MEKRYICFVCYRYHPEMRGVSEKEFKAGNDVCKEGKCVHKGERLEAAFYCKKCDKMLPFSGKHKHGD